MNSFSSLINNIYLVTQNIDHNVCSANRDDSPTLRNKFVIGLTFYHVSFLTLTQSREFLHDVIGGKCVLHIHRLVPCHSPRGAAGLFAGKS